MRWSTPTAAIRRTCRSRPCSTTTFSWRGRPTASRWRTSTAGRCGCWSRSGTSGSRRSTCRRSSSSTTTSPASGNATATTTMVIPGSRSGPIATRSRSGRYAARRAASVNGEDGLAGDLVVQEVLDHGLRLAPRDDAVDARLEAAVAGELREARERRGAVVHGAEHEEADDLGTRGAAEERSRRVRHRLLHRVREGDDSAERRHGTDRRRQDRTTDAVENRVVLGALGDAVDDLVGTQFSQALLAAGERRDVGAGLLGELDRERADAAGGAGDQDAGAQRVAADVERLKRRDAGDGQRGCLLEGDALGQLREPGRGHVGELCPGAAAHHSHHARALLRAAAVRGRLAHHAGDVPAGELAVLHVGEAPDLAAVEAERPDVHQRLVARGLRVGDLADLGGWRGGDESEHPCTLPTA